MSQQSPESVLTRNPLQAEEWLHVVCYDHHPEGTPPVALCGHNCTGEEDLGDYAPNDENCPGCEAVLQEALARQLGDPCRLGWCCP